MKGINKFYIGALAILMLASCKSSTEKKEFELKGVLTNNTAHMAYLEEIPMTTMQRVVVDSSVIDAKGAYRLHTATGEAAVYNLRLDQSQYPIAAVINDANSITLNATFNAANRQFPESYDVKGSAASSAMKDFLTAFNSKLQTIFYNAHEADSLGKIKGSDSLIARVEQNTKQVASEARDLTMESLRKSTNPALSMFILGYYQSTANNAGYYLKGLDKDEVTAVVDTVAARFPDHKGVAAIHDQLAGWVGKQAPDFTMSTPDGKKVSVSSFRGKYLLIDFWASWCQPCRQENPNVVSAYGKFKDKNFAILGVSLDKEKDPWLKAIMDDHLIWTQVSDLQEWQSPVVELYKFGQEGIPYNVLLDPNGKVIAEALRGEELEAKLAEVLH